MKKLRLLLMILPFLFVCYFYFANSSKARFAYGADNCIKCYEDLGCLGGDVKCAGFECHGQPVICYTIQRQN